MPVNTEDILAAPDDDAVIFLGVYAKKTVVEQ